MVMAIAWSKLSHRKSLHKCASACKPAHVGLPPPPQTISNPIMRRYAIFGFEDML